jgi:hypothetical protein
MATLSNNTTNDKSMNGLVTIDANSISTDELDVDTLVVNLSGTAPTVSALSNDTNIATTAWVTNHASATYVTLGTTQTVTGQKTFSNANTFITGNTVTNDIVSALPTSNINIGSALTTGDVNIGSSAGATGVALNWGGASNSGNLSFTGGSFTLTSSGIYTQRCGPTFGMTIADTQTSGNLNIGTSATRTGAINIGTGATTTSTAISIGNQTGAFGSCDIGTTTITVGKSNTATNNIQTSTNGTLNLKTTSTGGTVNLGTGMTSGNIFIGGGASSATNILIGSSQTTYTGSIAIGTVVTGNAPITIGSSTSTTQTALHNALTTFKKLVVVDDGILLRLGFSATGLTMGKTGTNEITFKLLDSSDILYFNDSTGTNIMYMSSTEIVNTKPTTFNNNILIAQSNYTQPFSSNTQLGYTDSETTFTDPMTSTLTARSDFLLPSKGVWLIICGYEWGANATNTIQNKEIVLSTTPGGSTQVAYGLQYYEEIDDSVGAINLRQQGTLSGVVTVTTSTTIYVNARSAVGAGVNTELRTNVSWTRIG